MPHLIASLVIKIKFWVYSSISPRFPSCYRAELVSIDKLQKKFSDKFQSNGIDLCFWRSVAQYAAHASFRSKSSVFIVNFLSFIGLFLILFYLRRVVKNKDSRFECDYIKFDFEPAYLIPERIKSQTIEVDIWDRYLIFYDYKFAIGLFLRHRVFNTELLLRFLWWITRVRPVIDLYKPTYILQYCEYSPHSSLRKAYLNANNVKLANVTHGEEYISTRSAFSTFDQYYHWYITDQFIYNSMKILSEEFISFNPVQNLDKALLPEQCVIGILWPSISSVDLDLLVRNVNEISTKYRVVVRPHPNPIYRNQFDFYANQLNADFSDSNFEDAHAFIDRTSVICGHASAIMVQAALRGRKVIYIIDGYYESLIEYHSYYKKTNRVSLSCLNKDSIIKILQF